jgi:energy-coupling factor transport system ATP-binding protein
VNLRIASGEFVAIVGQNGSGKTTLAKHFDGLLKPSSGVVRVGGRDTRELGTAALSRRVGYCFQNPDHQIFKNSVWEEVAFGPRNLGFEPDRLEAAVTGALEMVGLLAQREEYPFNLGKGERQKIALASIIAMETEVLVIDEPTTGLDWRSGSAVVELLIKLRQAGHTVIVITHDMMLVAEHIPRTIVLCDGAILVDGPTTEVLPQVERLERTFLAPPQITLFAQAFREAGFPPGVLTVEAAVRAVAQRA